MRTMHTSQTAQFMALFRALESMRPLRRRLFHDPLAQQFLPPALRIVVSLSRRPVIHRIVCAYIDRRWPGARTSGVARTRFIDDEVARALRAGAVQLVLLGARYDSRGYRMAESRKAQVFEVDHPATSKNKARLIKAIMGELPKNVSLVQIDFNRENLERVLEQAGYQPRLPTVFIWEGVSNYLRAEVVDSTLAFCGKAAPGSVLIFTYIDQEVLFHPESFYGTKRIMKLLTGVGERWTYGMEPGQVESHLERYGLQLQKDLAASDYRRLYYGEESAEMRGYEFYRVATAAVNESMGPTTNC